MKLISSKRRMAVVGLTVALIAGAGGLAFAYLTSSGNGTGSAQVFASESLTATVSGIGKLTYGGNPPKVQKNVSGLGSITAQ